MKSGLKPLKHDHRDYDFIKTKRLAGIIPAFPDNYNTDVGLWMPNQNADGQPFGCTNYAQSDLLIDQDKKLYNPQDLEDITHANANGGTDLRTSLKAVVKLHPDRSFLNVKPDTSIGGVLDWFDAVRVAILVGMTENRAVTIGTPWFPDFENPNPDGTIRDFTNWSVTGRPVGWHDWNGKGWVTIGGTPYLISKSWQGSTYGQKGYIYFSRTQFNRLMSIGGTAAFVLDKLGADEKPATIDSTAKQWLVSFFTALFRSLGL